MYSNKLFLFFFLICSQCEVLLSILKRWSEPLPSNPSCWNSANPPASHFPFDEHRTNIVLQGDSSPFCDVTWGFLTGLTVSSHCCPWSCLLAQQQVQQLKEMHSADLVTLSVCTGHPRLHGLLRCCSRTHTCSCTALCYTRWGQRNPWAAELLQWPTAPKSEKGTPAGIAFSKLGQKHQASPALVWVIKSRTSFSSIQHPKSDSH